MSSLCQSLEPHSSAATSKASRETPKRIGSLRHSSRSLEGIPSRTRISLGERQCTDLQCCLLFLVFLCGLGHIYAEARREGDLAKLTHGFDWRGDICGVDKAVRKKPLLFWCNPGEDQDFLLLDGVCVESCPTGANLTFWCPGPGRPFEYQLPGDAGSRSVVIGMTRNLTLQPGYKSTEALGYCFPHRDVKLLNRIILQTHVSTLTKQLFLAGHGAVESWRFLVGVAVVCIVIGYLFLFILWACFDKLIYGLVLIAHVLLLLCVVCFCEMGLTNDHDIFTTYFNDKTARLCAWTCAAVAFVIWVLFSLACCYGQSAVNSTIESVRATCEVIVNLPTMLLQPLIHSAIVISLLLLLLYGLAWVLSMGTVVPSDVPINQGGVEIAGLRRSFEFSSMQWLYLACWIFGIVWIFETLNALGQFAISYAVVVYECSSTTAIFPILQGYTVGLTYHLGTLAFGGLVVGCLKLLEAIFSFLTRQAQDDGSLQATVTKILCCCCANCAALSEAVVTMVNELIYTDVAIQGTSYTSAASHVVSIAGANPVTYALIKGSTTVVRFLGVGIIGGLGTFMSYHLLSSTALQKELNSVFDGASSMLTTSSIMGTTAASAVVCFYIAIAFMMVFYQTTYTLMYCMLTGTVKMSSTYFQDQL